MGLDIAELGFMIDSRQVKRAEGDVTKFTGSVKKSAASAKALETAFSNASRTFRRNGRALSRVSAGVRDANSSFTRLGAMLKSNNHVFRQTSLQLSQVAQQAAASGNVMRAFAIQLPDLLLPFGTIGIAAGAAVGALAPLAAQFIASADGANELAEAMETLTGSTIEMKDELERLKTGLATIEELRLQRELNRLIDEREKITRQLRAAEGTRLAQDLQFRLNAINEEVAAQQKIVKENREARIELEIAVRERGEALERARDLADAERLVGELLQVATNNAAALAGQLSLARAEAMATAVEFTKIQGIRSRFAGEDLLMSQPVIQVGRGEPPPEIVKSRGGGGASLIPKGLSEAQRLFDSTRTAAEKYAREVARVNELHAKFPEIVTKEVRDRALADLKETYSEASDLAGSAADSIESAFGSLIDDFVDGSLRGSRALEDLGKSLVSLALKAQLFKGLASAFPSVFGADGFTPLVASARGNVIDRGQVVPFAKGGIVSKPTLFPMARGAGLMGEAGPEAIVPLKRGPDGQLGVRAEGSGKPVEVHIHNNVQGARINQRRQVGPDGREMLIVEVSRAMAEGELDGSLSSRFATTPQKRRR